MDSFESINPQEGAMMREKRTEAKSLMPDPMENHAAELYLDLMKRCLTYYIWGEEVSPVFLTSIRSPWKRSILSLVSKRLSKRNWHLYRKTPFDPERRSIGRDHPAIGHTMIGIERLDNIHSCIVSVLRDAVPGDFIETGVWRGGAVIFMRAVLEAYQVPDRVVWAADSFEGLPTPDEKRYPADKGDQHHLLSHLSVSLEEVKRNIARYDLLDDQVRFLKGWFRDTLPSAPIETLAILRLDGDLYESTIQALEHLYPKLSVGGYAIVDDYGYNEACKKAVHDYRASHGIEEGILDIDGRGVYWRRSK
jgi:O-methyltransferase